MMDPITSWGDATGKGERQEEVVAYVTEPCHVIAM